MKLAICFACLYIQNIASFEVTSDLIKKVRDQIVSEADSRNDWDSRDIDRLKQDDWQVERFLLQQEDEANAVNAIKTTLVWRKSNRVNDLTEDYFPAELFKIGTIHSGGHDKDNRPVIIHQAARHKKSKQLSKVFQQFTIFKVEQADRQAGKNQWTYVANFENASFWQYDLQLSKDTVLLVFNNYPKGCKQFLLVECPALLKYPLKAIGLYNRELNQVCHYIEKHDLEQFISKDQLPVSMGGSRGDKPWNTPPDSCRPLKECSHLNMTDDDLRVIHEDFDEIMEIPLL